MNVLLALLILCSSLLQAAQIPHLTLDGGVDPGSADYIVENIRAAEAAGAPAVVLELNTPGGHLESTRNIVQAQLGSSIPVIVYVTPAGGRAASAGVFITMAAHVAAMAPGTTIGAAHPVDLLGGAGGEGQDGEEGGGSSVMQEKILADTVAWARAIAERRGRNAEWVEAAVRESVAVTDREAVELEVVDLVAGNLSELMEAIHGRAVETSSGEVILDTADAELVPVEMTIRQQVVHFLGDPNIIFILLALGALGIYVEFQNPGLVVPGVMGALLLLSAAVGLSLLPFNLGGLLLILLAFVLFALEIYVASFGILTAGGIVSLILGGILLFDVPEFDLAVAPATIITVALLTGLLTLLVGYLVLRAHRTPTPTGAEGLSAATGVVTSGGSGGGWVRLEGELWRARWAGDLSPGTEIRVREVRRLELFVEPTSPPPPPADTP